MNDSTLAEGRDPEVLSPEQARTLLAEGWQAADLHVHTLHSYDVIPTRQVDPLNLYLKARRLRHDLRRLHGPRHHGRLRPDRLDTRRPRPGRRGQDPRSQTSAIRSTSMSTRLTARQFRKSGRSPGRPGTSSRSSLISGTEGLPFIFNHPFWHEPDETPNLQAVLDVAELFPGPRIQHGPDRPHQRPGAPAGRRRVEGHRRPRPTATSGRSGGPSPGSAAAPFKEFFDRIAARESCICPGRPDPSPLQGRDGAPGPPPVRQVGLAPRQGFAHDGHGQCDPGRDHQADGPGEGRTAPGSPAGSSGRRSRRLSGSGIPGALYLRSQNGLADRVGRLLESAGTAAAALARLYLSLRGIVESPGLSLPLDVLDELLDLGLYRVADLAGLGQALLP